MPAASAVVALTNETMRPPTAARRRPCQELVRGAGTGIIRLMVKSCRSWAKMLLGHPPALGQRKRPAASSHAFAVNIACLAFECGDNVTALPRLRSRK